MANSKNHQVSNDSEPATQDFPITPSDLTTYQQATLPRGLWIGTGGNVAVQLRDNAPGVTTIYKNIANGTVLPLRPYKVLATGTTAGDIVGML